MVRTMNGRLIGLTAVCFVSGLLALSGCSFSYSSKSSSDSSASSSKSASSPFTSSSESSSPDKTKQYQEDVADYTTAYVRSSTGDFTAFQRGLGEIAARHGISNWEAQPITYYAVGVGLKKANLSDVQYETFKRNFAASDYSKMQDIQEGYDATR
jgi:hypothetical protein